MVHSDEEDDCLSIGSQDTDLEQEYVVEEILAVRRFQGDMQYLVKWEGYELCDCTWEPLSHVEKLDAFKDFQKKRKERMEGLLAEVDVKSITRQMVEGQAQRDIRQRRREKLRARRAAAAASSKKRKLQQRRRETIVIDSDPEFERPGSTSPSSVGTSSPAPSSTGAHTDENPLHGIARATPPSQPIAKRVIPTVKKRSVPNPEHKQKTSSKGAIQRPNSARAGTTIDNGSRTDTDKTKATAQAPFLEASDDDDSLFGPCSPNEPDEPVQKSLVTGTSAQSAGPSKPWVRVRNTGISMTTKPVVPKNLKTNKNPERTDEWKISRQWSDQKYILQNNHKPDAASLATWDKATGRFVPAQGDDLPRQTTAHRPVSPEKFSDNEPVVVQNFVNIHNYADRNPTRPDNTSGYAGGRATCRRWLKNSECVFGNKCKYLHEITDTWEPKAHQVCTFWTQNKCKHVAELCVHHHCHADEHGRFPRTATPAIGSYTSELRRQLSTAANASLDKLMAKHDSPRDQGSRQDQESSAPMIAQATHGERLAFLETKYGGTPIDKKSQTCRFWYRGYCRSQDRCEFAHQARTFLVPKPSPGLCLDWQKGRCAWNEAECLFHHCEADANNQAINFKYHMTCRAWLDGHCSKSAAACDCYHMTWDPQLREYSRSDQIALDDPTPSGADDDLFEPAMISTTMAFDTGDDVRSIPVNILISDQSSLSSVAKAYRVDARVDDAGAQMHDQANSSAQLVFRSTCRVPDLSLCIGGRYRISHEGLVVAGNSSDILDVMHSHLSDHESGAVAYSEAHMVVLHPTDDMAWRNFHSAGYTTPITHGNGLAMVAFDISSLPDVLQNYISCTHQAHDKASVSILGTSTDRPLMEYISTHGILGWNVANMLSVVDDKKDEKRPDKKVSKMAYLMFPLTFLAEMTALRLLLESAGFEVYTPEVPGSWKYDFLARALGDSSTCKDATGGVVIWHQAVFNYWEIAHMHYTLHRSLINHFIFETQEPGLDETQQSLSLTRIFPSGYAALMVDNIFIEEPLRALEVVKVITKDVRAAKQGHGYCLYASPNLLQFIHTLRRSSSADKVKANIYMQLGKMLWELENPMPLDPDGDTTMSNDGDKTSCPALVCPTIGELSNYCGRLEKNPEDATAALVEQFNLWTLSQVDRFRRFYVLVPKHGSASPARALEEGEVAQSPAESTTPRTPQLGDAQGKVSGDTTPMVRAWQAKYRHVFFRTTEQFVRKEWTDGSHDQHLKNKRGSVQVHK